MLVALLNTLSALLQGLHLDLLLGGITHELGDQGAQLFGIQLVQIRLSHGTSMPLPGVQFDTLIG